MDNSLKSMFLFFSICIVVSITVAILFPTFSEKNVNGYISQYDFNE